MIRYWFTMALLVSICFVQMLAQEFTIRNGSFFYEISGGGTSTTIHVYKFNVDYTLTSSDLYERYEDHLKFVPAESGKLSCMIDTMPKIDAILTKKFDFRSENRYSNNKVWYSLDPDDPIHRSARVSRKGDSRWELSTVTVTAKNRLPLPSDSIPGTWEIKFSPGFTFTKQLFAWDRIRIPKKVVTSGLEYGFVGSITTTDISPETTRDKYKLSRRALTLNTGALINLSLGRLDVGLYGGLDFAIGEGANDWIYQGQPNWGFIFGIDLIEAKN